MRARRHVRPTLAIGVVVAGLACSATTLHSTSAPPQIRLVTFECPGGSSYSEDELRLMISSRPGEHYDEARIDRDIRSLYDSALFETIEVCRTDLSSREVEIVFRLREKGTVPNVRIGVLQIRGNKRIEAAALWREVTVKVRDPLNERVLHRVAARLETLYQSRGWPRTKVTWRASINHLKGLAAVTFRISENR